MGDPSPPSTAGHRPALGVEGGKHSGAKAKRRTKTGCLTCRKRRIKCDEGRPTCRNCSKSKKQCEGYQTTRPQPRNTGNDFAQPNVGNLFPAALGIGELRQVYGNNPGQFPSILPRPIQHGDQHGFSPSESSSHWMPASMATNNAPLDPSQLSQLVAAQASMVATPAAYMTNFPSTALTTHFAHSAYNGNGLGVHEKATQGMSLPIGIDEYSPGAGMGTEDGQIPHDGSGLPMQIPNPVSPEGYVWNPSIQSYDPNLYSSIPPEKFDITETLLEEELFDVGSDEEGIDALERSDRTGLPLMMSVHGNFDIKALRTHDTFLNTPNILAHYEPQWFASPLMDPTTARIFGHFIAVTACHLSLGQRRASNPSLLFQPRAVPKSQQGLWTYILPQKALSNQGLMHAMLALASLQIAMLQGTDRHTARKHYHFAIQRNSKSVASTKKRTSIATIATTLLLAAFEVWAADHSNWNSHLLGARQLLLEADFVRMTRQIKEHKLAAAPVTNPDDPYTAYLMQKAGPVLQADFPDEEMLEHFMGYKLPYGSHGVETGRRTSSKPITQGDIDTHDSYADLFWFFVKQDIYYSTISSKPLLLPFERWGECPPRAPLGRFDAIYGTSDHLMLIYGRIARFINQDLARKKKAVEATGGRWRPPPGTFAEAAARSGGAGAGGGTGGPATAQKTASENMPPPPGMPMGSMPGRPEGPLSPQGPDFMGMIPEMPTPRIPSAFKQAMGGHAFIPAKREDEAVDEGGFENLEVAFTRAMTEWNEIQAALATFERELQAPVWQPLPFQATSPLPTHFSSARQYGDYRIADIWSMFYTAKIIMARMHPSMPPAAMMAAAVCKEQTAEWANKVGQIVFGMQTPQDNEPLNPTFASVLTQNMYTLFFAGVQYQEPEQRLVCVQRLQYIAEKVGHESAALIAAALETCWINAYRMGKGPEWQRTLGLAVDRDDENRSADFRTIERTKDSTTVTLRTDSIREQFGMGIMSLDSDFQQLSMD